ncbi:hypothetical protein C8R43DRAFT_1108761 [Mycena crocata]|nr:hypothetical protein C8R43DRAFT_1108761 [Mycena crocata]
MADPTTRKVLLTHRKLEVWMSDCKGHNIPHGPVAVSGNEISTTVQLPKGTNYSLFWRSSPGTTHTALCEIFVLHQGTYLRVGSHFMDKEKPETQCRSSKGRIRSSHESSGWLTSPLPSKKRFVALEVRRGKSAPIQEIPHANDKDDIEMELIDDPDDEPSQPPYIIFRFDFVKATKPTTPTRRCSDDSGSPYTSTVPQKRKTPDSGRTVVLRSPIRALSPLFSELTSDEESASVLEQVRNVLAEEEQIDAELRKQQLAAEEREKLKQQQQAADAEEEEIDAKLREQLITARKRLESKEKQKAANAEEEKADVLRRENLLMTEKRINDKKKLLGQ